MSDSSLHMAQKALSLSEKINYEKGKGTATRMIGIYFYLKGSYGEALGLYQKALSFSLRAKDLKGIANCYNNLGNIQHSQSNYKEAIALYDSSRRIREKTHDFIGIAQSFSNIGSVYSDQGNYLQALRYYFEALGVCERIGNRVGVASSYNNIGAAYKGLGQYDKALDYLLKSQNSIKQSTDKPAVAFAYNDIGNVYKDQGDYEKALEYFFSALKLFEEIESNQGIATTYTHIGNVYRDQGDYAKAQDYFFNSLKIKQKQGDKRGIANSYSDLGGLLATQKSYDKALSYHLDGLKIREEIKDNRGIILTCINLADVFIPTKNFDKAFIYLQKGLALTHEVKSGVLSAALLAKYAQYFNSTEKPSEAFQFANQAMDFAKQTGNLENIRDAAQQKYIAASRLWHHKEAFENLQLFVKFRDSIQNAKNIRTTFAKEFAFKEQKAKLENEKRQNKLIEAQNRQRRLAIAFGGISVAIGLISLLIYRNNRQKKKANQLLVLQKKQIEEAKAELEKLNAVKNRLLSVVSHDVKSPLNSLKAVLRLFESNALSQAELQGVVANIGNQVGQITYFLDNLLRWTKNQLEQVEPKPVKIYLRPVVDETIELLSVSAKIKMIDLNSNISDDISVFADEEMMKIVLRNLVSNAIKFCKKSDCISIEACPKAEDVVVSVEDTGSGIRPEQIPELFNLSHLSTKGTQDEVGTGIGLSLCKEFVEKNGGKISVASTAGKGSRFEFTLPIG
ncbi:MAG: tetratricopeptide repeat-containing sensor histidine kinase [Bacteroidetes bacterium]|nr:tetratricopeptide repeat-containing sensor histidine kinase [Bacteroidota bacterium]